MLRPYFAAVLFTAVAAVLSTPATTAAELKPLFQESFDQGTIDGPVGKAGPRLSVPAPGKIDLDRGTLAFFTRLEKDPTIAEWQQLGGVHAEGGGGYWYMLLGFDIRKEDFLFNFYDAGLYAPPMHLGQYFGKWKAGEWHHLAAVWDRTQGITVYIDGKEVASNWGQYQREFNAFPATLFVNNTVDEVYTYAEALSAAQVAQLARGEKPTGDALPSAADQRQQDLARMGWDVPALGYLPTIEAGKTTSLTFARIARSFDDKHAFSGAVEGLLLDGWPALKYGPSTRGKRLDLTLPPGQNFDRARFWVQRPFKGTLTVAGAPQAGVAGGMPPGPTTIDAPVPTMWNRPLGRPVQATQLALNREIGRVGQIDFYRADAVNPPPVKELETYALQRATEFPTGDTGDSWRGETAPRFQNPVLATKKTVPAWTLAAPAFGGFQATTELTATANAYDGVVVTLVADGLTAPTPVRVQVKEPVHGQRDWLVGDVVLRPKGAGRQTFTVVLKGRPVINMPELKRKKYLRDGKYSDELESIPAIPFGLKVMAGNPVNWVMGAGGTTLALHRTDMAKALPAAADDQVEYMREGYAELMEGHAYSNKRMMLPLMWLAKFAPTRMEFRQLYNRSGRQQLFEGLTVPPYTFDYPVNKTGAPEWAFWQMQVMNEHRKVLNYFIDKQVSTGEYGGVWNDDTDHIENWFDHAMCMDDSGRIKGSIQKLLDGLWNIQLNQGVGKYVQDTLHYYEEGMGTLGMATVMNYGDVATVEHTMAASSHYDKWLTQRDGKWVMKSPYPGINGSWMEREFDITKNNEFGGYIMIPGCYMIWYNRHPGVAQYFKGWQGTWKDGGIYESAAERVGDFAKAKQDYAEGLAKPLGRYGVFAPVMWVDEIGVTDAARKTFATPYKEPGPIDHYWGARDTDIHWLNYKVSGDIRWLTESYKRTWEWFPYHDWLNTAAMPSMDRNPLPRWSLIRARMGSLATNRGALVRWPLHAISYTKGADDVAAIVSENLENRFSARFYPFTDKPHDMQIRVWRCDPGTYQVSLASDKDDNGEADGTLWQKEMTLDRGAYIDLTLPARQVSLLTVTPIATKPFNYDRADPAISRDTVDYVYGEHLVVHVHNLGTKAAENVKVRVRDARTGQIVVNGEVVIDRIEAPLDLKPRSRAAEFKNLNANTYTKIIIEVDPDHQIDDLNPYNNTFVIEGPTLSPM